MDWFSIIFAIITTLVIYGAGPLIFLFLRKKPISRRLVRVFCITYTVFVWIVLRLYLSYCGFDPYNTGGPALIWGVVFYKFVLSKLRISGKLADNIPAIPNVHKEPATASREISLSYQSDFKIKHYSEPIDTRTFRICPGCGSLLPTDILTCDCGHTFKKTTHQIGLRRLMLSCLSVVLILSGSSYASYRLGQNSMSDELQQQYSEGQKEGSRNGYKIGYHDAKASSEYEFESGYRTAMADIHKETLIPSSSYIVQVHSELHDTLSAEYGVSAFIPKPNFVQPTPSQSSSDVSSYDSTRGKTGTALDKYSLDKYSLDKYRLK